MASDTASPKYTFVVYAPDLTDPEAFDRRMKVRQQHLSAAVPANQSGYLKMGGAMLTPESLTAQPGDKKLVGSILFYEASSIEEVRKSVEEDVYYSGNVVRMVIASGSATLD
ncbi:hypothetical protein FRC02_002988 [Tulasnella sp. 418]|nr:hypothetical protein FRC02_002988 [Tulasnella sp. 418]